MFGMMKPPDRELAGAARRGMAGIVRCGAGRLRRRPADRGPVQRGGAASGVGTDHPLRRVGRFRNRSTLSEAAGSAPRDPDTATPPWSFNSPCGHLKRSSGMCGPRSISKSRSCSTSTASKSPFLIAPCTPGASRSRFRSRWSPTDNRFQNPGPRSETSARECCR